MFDMFMYVMAFWAVIMIDEAAEMPRKLFSQDKNSKNYKINAT